MRQGLLDLIGGGIDVDGVFHGVDEVAVGVEDEGDEVEVGAELAVGVRRKGTIMLWSIRRRAGCPFGGWIR